MKRPPAHVPEAPIRSVWRPNASIDDTMIADLRKYLAFGAIVYVVHQGGAAFTITLNGSGFFVRSCAGQPWATVSELSRALAAGYACYGAPPKDRAKITTRLMQKWRDLDGGWG